MSENLYSVEAEQSVLGSLMVDPALIDKLAFLTDKAFYFQGHQAVYRAIQRLYNASKDCDTVSVWTSVEAAGDQDHLGDMGAVENLRAWANPRTAMHHAQVVADKYKLRCLLERLDKAQELAYGSGDVSAKLDQIASILSGLDASNGRRAPRPMAELMIEAMDNINAAADGTLPQGWSTTIPTLDKFMGGGLLPGKLVILAARPSVGKSSFSMHVAAHVSYAARPTLVISQEMECAELAQRAIANAARVKLDGISSGKLTEDEWSRIAEGIDQLGGAPIWIDDEPGQSLRAINSKARSVKGLRLLVVDYLQLCEGEGDTRSAAVGSVSRGLKKLAKEMNCCVIALSQLNRKVDERADKRPVMSDLRDSGEIEQDADLIWFLWPLEEGEVNQVGLEVAKNRGGKKGVMVLNFEGATQRWSESTRRIEDFQSKRQSKGDWE